MPALKVFFNLPNSLTHLRIIAIWPIKMLIEANSSWALPIYFVALATDFFDGKTAVWFNQHTRFGKLYDPLADKILHLGILATFYRRIDEPIIPLFTILTLAVILAALPGLTTLFRIERPMGANLAGKLKMTAEALGIICLFAGDPILAVRIFWWSAIPLAVLSVILHLTLKSEFSAIRAIRSYWSRWTT